MYLCAERSKTGGKVRIPGSKSHTIRSLFIASLCEGKSQIRNPLISNDALSALKTCRSLGAVIEQHNDYYSAQGFGGIPSTPEDIIDVGNSGTTLRFAVMAAALGNGYSVFTGDYQIRRRPLAPLIDAINGLGAEAVSTRSNGMAPVIVKGRASGGKISLDAVTSQYLSSILISAPLLDNDTEITLTRLNEVPYVEMTLWWLDKQGIKYQNDNFEHFHIYGRQKYKPFDMAIPGDFSSATFFMVLAAISGGEFILENLDMTAPQGDKRVLSILAQMGSEVKILENAVYIKGNRLKGMEIDMNSIPDALPAMAVASCFAEGETRLVNVPQARLKETDRIHVMCQELSKMGADITELEDGLVIRQSRLKGCRVSGHYDHRVVMSLAVAGLNSDGVTIIDTAEAMNVTFPEFADFVRKCGGSLEMKDTDS
ncbi:MAG: 3-phosphoshikimate 1-carboxyvinyltransferase [Bacillota bacterium]|nr:3-phosphoshikimate 1-carboxyvinyltransferase [Bacillota bacterium]